MSAILRGGCRSLAVAWFQPLILLGAQAGLQVLRSGGNAVDAIIATAAVMTIVEPCSNGLGSDAYCILWDGKELYGLNASGMSPAGWSLQYFIKKYGEGRARPPARGWDSVTVPGAVASWIALHERWNDVAWRHSRSGH